MSSTDHLCYAVKAHCKCVIYDSAHKRKAIHFRIIWLWCAIANKGETEEFNRTEGKCLELYSEIMEFDIYIKDAYSQKNKRLRKCWHSLCLCRVIHHHHQSYVNHGLLDTKIPSISDKTSEMTTNSNVHGRKLNLTRKYIFDVLFVIIIALQCISYFTLDLCSLCHENSSSTHITHVTFLLLIWFV